MNKKKMKDNNKNAPKNQDERVEENKETGKETKKVTQDTGDLEKQLQEMENNWKRALADYKNLQRRTIKEKEDAVKFSNFVLASELIPVYDNLLMVEKHSEDQGLKMVVDQFWEVLKTTGIEKIEAGGKEFDENLMEAIEAQEVEDETQKGKVLEVLQNGYKFKDRVLKPVKVVVGKTSQETSK
ncbi:nucleotide exchange factor GrpE [candidate division WWE3 bacterium]|nr:nucleotide exchange factor GrpE [candidate division WWE3 bacterium]